MGGKRVALEVGIWRCFARFQCGRRHQETYRAWFDAKMAHGVALLAKKGELWLQLSLIWCENGTWRSFAREKGGVMVAASKLLSLWYCAWVIRRCGDPQVKVKVPVQSKVIHSIYIFLWTWHALAATLLSKHCIFFTELLQTGANGFLKWNIKKTSQMTVQSDYSEIP